MAYQVGNASANMIDAKTFFGVYPRSVWTPGERVATHASTVVYRGYAHSVWNFGWMEIETYRKALAVLCGSTGTGTVSGTLGATALTGVTTAFDTELAVCDVLAVNIGSGVYEIVTITSIKDADELTAAAAFGQTFSGKGFLYRKRTVYSGGCYVTTRNDLDCYQTWSAIAVMPEPDKLERAGGKYLNVGIDFTLIGVV